MNLNFWQREKNKLTRCYLLVGINPKAYSKNLPYYETHVTAEVI